MVSTTVSPSRNAETIAVLDDLVRESLWILATMTIGLAWIWSAAVIVTQSAPPAAPYGVLVLAAVTLTIGLKLSARHLGLAVATFLVGLNLIVSVIIHATHQRSELYLFVLVVLVAGVLADHRVLLVTSLASIGLILVIGNDSLQLSTSYLLSPITYVVLSALTAWLSSRRLFTALAWAVTMTHQSQANAREAQDHRAEVVRVLKCLDEAYVHLEHANEALIFAREAADKAYRFKAEFVANVSHELRTPLNLIIGFSEMIATAPESYRGIALPSEYRGDVMAIYRSARHLADLINDVLDLSRVEAGRLPLNREPCDFRQIIGEATDIVRGLAEANGLRLDTDIPATLPLLLVDSTRIRQVLLNLLTNAIRFTSAGWIRVNVQIEESVARVLVTDSGCGIAPERLKQAFEAFSQLGDDQARKGTGLGLALSKRFIELHGGSMWIESTVDVGTTVGFTLPVDRVDFSLPLAAGSLRPYLHSSRPRVLVCQDNPSVLWLLRRRVEGYDFISVGCSEQIGDLIEQVGPVAVIVDEGWASRHDEAMRDVAKQTTVPVLRCPLPAQKRLGGWPDLIDYLDKPLTREQLELALARLPASPKTALVVDDDLTFTRILSRMLKASSAHIRVFEASGGIEGLDIARSQRPDVIFIDMLMPDLSGYDFLDEVRRDCSLHRTDIIIISAQEIEPDPGLIVGDVELALKHGLGPTATFEIIQSALRAVMQPVVGVQASALPRP